MFCSISGEVPQEPVVSKKSGLLFEKRLIEKYIIDQGKCPVTGEDLTTEELLPIQANKAVRPRPISGSSIPGLLVAFQNEWDEVMLETFTLKQHLDTTRQELAQALYQHDAACRVIARLMQERDLARQQLATLQAQGFVASDNSEQAAMNVDSSQGNGEADTGKDGSSEKETVGQLVDEAVQDLVGTCGELSAARKARKGPAAPVAPSKEAVKGLEVRATHTPHKADSKTSISCVALHANFPISVASTGKTGSKRGKAAASSHAEEADGAATGAVVLSGSTDKNVLLTQLETGRVLAKLAGHSKKVTAVSFHCTASTATSSTSTALFSASADATVKMWSSSGDDAAHYSEAWSYGGHDQEVHSLCMHPSGKYVVSVGSDGWHFLDVLREGAFLQGTKNAQWSSDPAARYSCGAFHPDGLILGTGSAAGSLRIWDVRTLENPHSLAGHAGAAMTCLAFSENGYQAASGGADGSVHLWDLRKLAFTQTLQLSDGAVGGVAFDQTGTFLAMGGAAAGDAARLQVRVVKDWSECADLSSAHSKAVMGVAWPVAGDSSAAQLVSCGADRSIKVFGAAAV